MPLERLRKYLDEHHVRYELIPHLPTFTAQETAAATHTPGKAMAKTLIVGIDGRWAMVVLPATDQLDLERLRHVTGAAEVRLASEDDFKVLFDDCEPGAMPPFGNLYDLPVFVDAHLREDVQIAFEAGSHHELIRMPYADYERLVEPVVATIHT
ncbi:MAG: YbaK/EbsC family protein [Phycisphaeraceae bacterium]